MDSQKTAPFELGHGDDACLLIHGFTGSPWDLRPLGEELARRGYYVRAPRLPGHGSSPEAMLQVSRRDWEQATEDSLLSLRNFRQVFVAGLSMGALLGLLLAARHPERVHGLALMAPPVRFREPRLNLLRAFRRLPLLELLKPMLPKAGTDIEDPQARDEAPVLPAFPSARLHDLWAVQDQARAAVPQVKSPVLIVVAEKDHVVDPRGARELARELTGAPLVRFIKLREGYHILPRDLDRALLVEEVGTFFDRLRG